MRRLARSGNTRVTIAIVAAVGLIGLDGLAGCAARAQTQPQPSINLGGRSLGAAEAARTTPRPESEPDALQFSLKAGIASDYVYRGLTLSDRQGAGGAGIEATYRWLYAGAAMASVRLPTQPSAEISLTGGVRPTWGPVEFDLGVTYFAYPGELPGGPTNGTEYWEAAFRAAAPVTDLVRVAAGYAYSPNVSNTGAWSQYAAAGFGVEVPARLLPPDVGVSFTAAAGYSWFGRQAPALGGFALPAYLNWQAGVTFSHKLLNVDLRYHDTNLSRESCYVLTGDPNAVAGGRINSITNPDGLMSRWCGAALVAKVWIGLN
jgi:uncharacterized protein (TIGR02001 family)